MTLAAANGEIVVGPKTSDRLYGLRDDVFASGHCGDGVGSARGVATPTRRPPRTFPTDKGEALDASHH